MMVMRIAPLTTKSAIRIDGELVAAVEQVADGKERRPDRQAAGDPADRRLADAIAVPRGLALR